jgi:hypothetical protein
VLFWIYAYRVHYFNVVNQKAKKRALLDIRQDKEKRKERQDQKAIHQVKQQQQQQQETAPKGASSSSSTVSKGNDTAFIQVSQVNSYPSLFIKLHL